MFKVIIAGNRKFDNYVLLQEKCSNILSSKGKDIEVISGTAVGADKLGERYAKEYGLSLKQFPAPWTDIEGKPENEIGTRYDGTRYWKKAGTFRNTQMAEYADAAIIFWDGNKRSGSYNMINQAKRMGLLVREIKYKTL